MSPGHSLAVLRARVFVCLNEAKHIAPKVCDFLIHLQTKECFVLLAIGGEEGHLTPIATAMYFSLSLPLLPGRLPVLPELPGQQIRDMQVVRSPPSEPTNGRPRSLHRHLGLRDGRWSHRFHWCHWCHRCRATASTAVRFCRLCPLFPSQPPFPLQALKG